MSDSSDELTDTTPKQQAVDWLIRLRDDQLTDADLEEFAGWLACDPSHSDAYNAAEALFQDMVLAAHEPEKPSDVAAISVKPTVMNRNHSKPRQRRRLQGAAAIAAAWLLATQLILPRQAHWLDAMLSDYRTQTGEWRDIRLSDGSRLMLNTDSAISVQFDAGLRRIVLHHGQASFSVAPDSNRPFEVAAADVTVRALGTIFDVYKTDADLTRIEVKEHAVAVSAGRETQLEVAAGQAVELREGRPLAPPRPGAAGSIRRMAAASVNHQRQAVSGIGSRIGTLSLRQDFPWRHRIGQAASQRRVCLGRSGWRAENAKLGLEFKIVPARAVLDGFASLIRSLSRLPPGARPARSPRLRSRLHLSHDCNFSKCGSAKFCLFRRWGCSAIFF